MYKSSTGIRPECDYSLIHLTCTNLISVKAFGNYFTSRNLFIANYPAEPREREREREREGGGGRADLPKGFSSITFEKNKLETPNFA